MLSINDAAIIIQRNKYKTMKSIFNDYLSDGLIKDKLIKLNFEEITILLKKKSIINNTKLLIIKLFKLIKYKYKYIKELNKLKKFDIKIFIVSYMIYYYPNESLNIDIRYIVNKKEELLYNSSKNIVELFDNIQQYFYDKNFHINNIPKNIIIDFIKELIIYINNFNNWKKDSSNKLQIKICNKLDELYKLQNYILDKDEINNKIIELKNNLQLIGGNKALIDYEKKLLLNVNNNFNNINYKFFNFNIEYNDEMILHELLLDINFIIDNNNNTYKKLVNDIYWTSLINDLKYVIPEYKNIIKILIEINNQLDNIIDIDHIYDIIKKKLFNWELCKNLFNTIFNAIKNKYKNINIFNKINDEWDEILIKISDYNDNKFPEYISLILRFLFEKIHILNHENYTNNFKKISLEIKNNPITYYLLEQNNFQKKLDNKTLTLNNTIFWINKIKFNKEDNCDNQQIFFIIEIITQNNFIDKNLFPEILLFDRHHLLKLHYEFYSLTKIITSVIVLQKFLKERNIIINIVEIAKIFNNIEEIVTIDNIWNEINNYTNTLITEENKISLKKWIYNINDISDPLHNIIINRLKMLWYNIIINNIEITNIFKIFDDKIKNSVNKIKNISNLNILIYNKYFKSII